MKKRIGILTGGGDCPGLNPAIKWVVKTALDRELAEERGYGFEMIGLKDGWRSLVNYEPEHPILPMNRTFGKNDYARVLTEKEVRTWDRLGGTNLGSSRTNPFNKSKETWPQVVASFQAMELEALVAIGGDDTLGIASRLSKLDIPVVCIPKTIDRDLQGTEYTLGFETAVSVIVEEIDRLRTTAQSHSRTFIVETMGRYAGHLALSGGLAAGADVILIPEVPFRVERVVEILREKLAGGQRYSIVVVAEGAKLADGDRVQREASAADQFGHPTLGGIAKRLEKVIEKGTGVEVRSVVLSHLQRGGVPCAIDRRMARTFGIAAVDLLTSQRYGRMVVWKDGKISSIEIPENLHNIRQVDVVKRYDDNRYVARYNLLED